MSNKDIKDATPEEIATHNRNAGYQLGSVAMRSLCVEKVKSIAAKYEREQFAEAGNQRIVEKTRLDTANQIIKELVSIQEQKA